MKLWKLLLPILVLGILLAGCKDTSTPANTPGTETTPTAQTGTEDEYETLYYSFYTYRLYESGDAQILHYYGMEEVCEIPGEINGAAVISLDEGCFAGNT